MIDWTRIADLRLEIGDDNFAEVVDLFLEETDEVVLRLLPGRPMHHLADDLHFLKGSALNLGFSDLATLCADGERQASPGGNGVIDLSGVVRCYHASKAAFLDGLSDAAAA